MATIRPRPTAPPAPGALPHPGPAATSSGGQRALDWLKRWAIPLIGGITPVALIVINISVWINDHIGTLRLWVAIAAFVSGMMFNSWLGLSVYRWVQRRHPGWALMHDTNQEVLLVVGMGVITLVTFLTSLSLYLALKDATALPNAWTLWYGIVQIAYPFVLKVYVDRDQRRKARGEARGLASTAAVRAGPPATATWDPGAPPGTLRQVYPPQHRMPAPPPPEPPSRGGYLPPS